MKEKTKVIINLNSYLLLIIILFTVSCENSEKTDLTPDNPLNIVFGEIKNDNYGEIIYQDKTVVLNNQLKNNLLEVSQNYLIFNYSSSFELLKQGDVLFSGKTELAPNGFARKILLVEKNDQTVRIITSQANAEDVFEKVRYKEDLSLDFDNIKNLLGNDNVDLRNNQSPSVDVDFNVNNERVDITLKFDYDNNFQTKADQLDLSGFVEISHIVNPSLIYNFDLFNPSNNVLSLTGLTDITLGGEITYGGKKSYEFIEDDFVNANTNQPLEIDRSFELISIPLTGLYTPSDIITQPEIIIFARFQVDITGKISIEFSKTFRYNYNISYLGATTGNGWDNTFEEVLDDSWNFDYGATAEIELEATPFAVGPIIAFPQFLLQGNNPSFVGVFIYPWTQKVNATIDYNSSTQCFETDIIQQNKWEATFEAQISTLFNNNESIDIDLVLYSESYTTDNNFSVPDFCFTSNSIPTLTTEPISNITQTSAISGGNITDSGGSDITSRGICWSNSPDPIINDNITNDGTGSGSFTSNINNLNPNTTYYVKAYAINSSGIAYGNQRVFTTDSNGNSIPTLTTNPTSNITQTSATSGGNITSDGGNDITLRGICWSVNPNPTINDNTTNNGEGAGNFTSIINNLNTNTTYYIKAYAINNEGVAYGNQQVFTTNPDSNTTPTLTTNPTSNITQTSATSGGNITSDGGNDVTLRGVCWSNNPNPTINDNTTNNGGGTGNFTSNINNLNPNTTYYIKAYAINGEGIAYGNQQVFTTDSNNNSIPTLTTNPTSNITETSATSGGNVTSDGGNNVTLRGICWSNNPNPTINDNITNNGGGTGNFTSNINNLNPSTTYYIKAYAINNEGVAYGDQQVFTTLTDSSQPNLIFNDFRIDNDDNNNEIVEAGEDIDLDIQVRNIGNATANNVEVYIDTNDTDINISDNSQGYGDVSQGAYEWNSGNLDFQVSPNCPTKTVNFTITFTSDEGSWSDNFSIDIQGQDGNDPIPITPTDSCYDAPTLEVGTEYIVNVNTSMYGFGEPIDGESDNGNDVRGFWIEFNQPSGYIGDIEIQVYDVSANFDPVIGTKLSCNGIYYEQSNSNSFVANDNGYGGSETFTTYSGNNGYTERVRIYHYYGNETSNITFKIKVELQ
ncbi:hypothetical protein ACFO3O_21250 [Dokdonia ponticola]|uniref:Fibronectin type-III domain-containing protein n=1 Tax=Dokdonia ponticola TaxID=2041041 RepID=A0ABV9I2W0_9FLAO